MELIEKIKQHELESYRLYANRIPTTFGCLYFNSDNPESYDSNHAHITHYDQPLEALELIELFYLSKGILPRVYGQTAGELERLRPSLARRGFQISSEAFTLMVCPPGKAVQSSAPEVSVRLVREVEEVAPILRAVDKGDWNVKAVKGCLASPFYALFAAYEGDQAVSMAALQTHPELGVGLVNNVMTHPDFQNRGLCTAVMNELVAFNQSSEAYPLYLFTSNPAAQRIYSKVGFTPFPQGDYQAFSAWKEIQIRL